MKISFCLGLLLLTALWAPARAQESPPTGEQHLGPVTLKGTGGSDPSLETSWEHSLWNPTAKADLSATFSNTQQTLNLDLHKDLGASLQAVVHASETVEGAHYSEPQVGADLERDSWKLGGSARPDGWYEVHLAMPLTSWWTSKLTYASTGSTGVTVTSPTTEVGAQAKGDEITGTVSRKTGPGWFELDATYKGPDLEGLQAGYKCSLGPLKLGAKAGRTFAGPESTDSVTGDLQYQW